MKLTTLQSAILLSACVSPMAFAGGLDRSGQSISAFLQPGNYFEAGISVLDPSVSGQDKNGKAANDMAGDYYFPTAALKVQATDHISLGLLYDQPYGADAKYEGENAFVSGANVAPLGISGGTEVTVKTQSLSLLMGYQPNENWNLYAGPVYQSVNGDVKLRGTLFSVLDGYNLETGNDYSWGWLAGVAYQIPEIALKASLTYRSEVEHKIDAKEQINYARIALKPYETAGLLNLSTNPIDTFTFSTPQSVNLDLQTGIMANTIAFANIRWVNWSNFVVRPFKLGQVSQATGPLVGKPNGYNLIDYKDDQISVNAGVGRKFNDKWGANLSVGWDSGAGNPVTTLGPTEGYWSVGTGVRYNPAKNYFIGAGVKYFWLGDADAVTGAHTEAGRFSNNHAVGYGLNIGYNF
ncbi:transporter [Acinetobacter cumulans]|uniref:Transporter n=1 Tax=Acinetobacter cumulans TaxID=2136182 RepID=A0A3A8G845_9GAMM|nr:outer membrane protein transport protein [Acinetobacter cumulans]RKG55055.1 transporter [Acinetobacter cumulans]